MSETIHIDCPRCGDNMKITVTPWDEQGGAQMSLSEKSLEMARKWLQEETPFVHFPHKVESLAALLDKVLDEETVEAMKDRDKVWVEAVKKALPGDAYGTLSKEIMREMGVEP